MMKLRSARIFTPKLSPPKALIMHKQEIVLVCAWCPASSYRSLKTNQVYSHGICQRHQRLILNQEKFTRPNAAFSLVIRK